MRLLFALALLLSVSAGAVERILEFKSDIVIHRDTSILVHETIKVWAENDQIRHGILREFPLQYKGRLGDSYDVRFALQKVSCDGDEVPVKESKQSNGIVLRLGDANTFIKPGEHTYEITYVTTGQIGFFKEFDELYWNVTGNGWRLPIDLAKATISLPAPVAETSTKLAGYTGYFGDKGRDFVSSFERTSSGEISGVKFATTRPLNRTEGLTVAVSWPKGLVDEPTPVQKATWFLRDNMGVWAMLVGLVAYILFLFRTQRRIRANNTPGTIIPLFAPPSGMLPSQVRYVARKGYDAQVLSCEIVNLAVMGYLTIHFESGFWRGKYSVLRTTKPAIGVSEIHQSILDALFADGKTEHEFSRSESEMIALVRELRSTLNTTIAKPNFSTYYRSFAVGCFLSGAMLIAALLLQRDFGIGFFTCLGVVLLLNIIFATHLKAYTKNGRKLMDQIEGFKLFLTTAEAERIKLMGTPPTRTPELYEKFLPYAIALGVEEQWSRQFTPVFEGLEQQQRPYSPVWFIAPVGTPFHPANFSSSFTSSLNSAISSSSSAPGSSSGSGGGGSSGGGGGGGGGGGW